MDYSELKVGSKIKLISYEVFMNFPQGDNKNEFKAPDGKLIPSNIKTFCDALLTISSFNDDGTFNCKGIQGFKFHPCLVEEIIAQAEEPKSKVAIPKKPEPVKLNSGDLVIGVTSNKEVIIGQYVSPEKVRTAGNLIQVRKIYPFSQEKLMELTKNLQDDINSKNKSNKFIGTMRKFLGHHKAELKELGKVEIYIKLNEETVKVYPSR